jgi:hypothetical protein
MNYDIVFIKWKNLITKSVDDLVLTWWFECWIDLYNQLHLQLNKPLKLIMQTDDWLVQEFNANINTDTKNYIWFVEDHWVFKLDILFPDILLTGFLFKAKLFLNIE